MVYHQYAGIKSIFPGNNVNSKHLTLSKSATYFDCGFQALIGEVNSKFS